MPYQGGCEEFGSVKEHWLTQVHLVKWSLKRCVCVCVCVKGWQVASLLNLTVRNRKLLKESYKENTALSHCSTHFHSRCGCEAELSVTAAGDVVYCREAGLPLLALHSRRSTSGTMTTESGSSQFYTKVIMLPAAAAAAACH